MSRRVLAAVCILATGFVLVQVAIAQEATATREATTRESARPPRAERQAMREFGEGMLDQIIKELQLAAEKDAQVRQALQTYFQALRNWQNESGQDMRELWMQLREARQADDPNKVKEVLAELKKLNDSRIQLRENLIKQLTEVLTPQQMEKLKDFVIEWRMRLRPLLLQLELTDEQKAKVAEIVKNWREEQEAEPGPPWMGRGFANLLQKIVTDVILTPEQRDALQKMAKEGDFFEKVKGLNLTDTQRAQIEKFANSLRRGRQARGEREGQPAGERGGRRGPETAPAGPAPPPPPPMSD